MTDPARGNTSSLGRPTLAASLAIPVCLVLLIFVWFISAGLWNSWPKTAVYNYYSSLAAAFQTGHLALADKPSPELLALPDPYRIGSRKAVDYIWDATLYDGQYFLYWGPVPALVLIPVRLMFGNADIPDLYLAFAFVAAVFLVLAWFLWCLWRRFFTSLPPWTLSLALLASGLAPPLTWMLNRPEVYEAALAAGQFFLLGGIYFGYSVVAGMGRRIPRLALASLSLGLAIGCRTSEALPAAFVAMVLLLFILLEPRTNSTQSGMRRSVLALGIPLLTLITLLLAYNWARFGSILEFGYRYQLTLVQMPKHYNQLFSIRYIPPNLYNYLFNPFTLATDFPPIRPQYGATGTDLGFVVPSIYFAEAVTGLAWTFPFLAFIFGLLIPRRKAAVVERRAEAIDAWRWRWLIALILGVLVLECGQLLLFFFATERYLIEVTPTLALGACLGFWMIFAAARTRSTGETLVSAAAIVLVAASTVGTMLLAISSYQERMRVFNPGLFAFLNGLFRR